MNQKDFDFDLETPRHTAVWSNIKAGFNNTVNYVKDNPGDIILLAVGVLMLDIDDSLDAIEEYEEIQTAIDIYELNGGA